MAITIAQIKELREATSAGMGACKEALNATNGDKEKAAETLKVNLSTLYRKLSDD